MNRMSMAQQLNEQIDGESILDGILGEVANSKSAFSGVGADVAAASLSKSKRATDESRAKGLVARKNASAAVEDAFTDPNASDTRDLFSLMKADETNNKAELDADREARIIKASSVVPVATDTSTARKSNNYKRAKDAIDANNSKVVSEQDQTFLAGEGLKEDDSGNAAAIDSAVREAVDNDIMFQSPDSITTDEERAEDAQSGSGVSIDARFPDDVTTTPATTATTGLMSRPYDADRMKDINESTAFKNYKYNLTNSTNTDNDVKNVQGMLTELGYKAGKADNVSGPGTERALRKFQAINGLTINGKLDDETMAKLKSSDVPMAFPDPPKKDARVTVLLDTDLEIFNTEVGKIESGNAYTYYKYDTPDGKYKKGDLMYGGAGGAYLGRYQMGTAALKDSGYNTAKKHNNMTTAQKEAFIKDPDLQDAEFKKYTKKNHIHLTKNSQAYRDMTKEEKLGILGYAHNQGATAAEEYLVTGVSGSDAFGTKGTKYTDALRVAFAEQVRTQSKAQ